MDKLYKICEKCGEKKKIFCFFIRDDRTGLYYAWCAKCMHEQHRDPDYPKQDERGGGNIELEPRD